MINMEGIGILLYRSFNPLLIASDIVEILKAKKLNINPDDYFTVTPFYSEIYCDFLENKYQLPEVLIEYDSSEAFNYLTTFKITGYPDSKAVPHTAMSCLVYINWAELHRRIRQTGAEEFLSYRRQLISYALKDLKML